MIYEKTTQGSTNSPLTLQVNPKNKQLTIAFRREELVLSPAKPLIDNTTVIPFKPTDED